VRALFARYEKDTIRLQATRKLEVEAIVKQAVAEFQAKTGAATAPASGGQGLNVEALRRILAMQRAARPAAASPPAAVA
jgi:hypothetical protein